MGVTQKHCIMNDARFSGNSDIMDKNRPQTSVQTSYLYKSDSGY